MRRGSPQFSTVLMDVQLVQRRRASRHRIEAAVLICSVVSHASRGWRGHCINLSEGGAGVIVGGPWTPGQVVRLEVALPNTPDSVAMIARIAHRNQLYCGLEFLATNAATSAAVRTVLAS